MILFRQNFRIAHAVATELLTGYVTLHTLYRLANSKLRWLPGGGTCSGCLGVGPAVAAWALVMRWLCTLCTLCTLSPVTGVYLKTEGGQVWWVPPATSVKHRLSLFPDFLMNGSGPKWTFETGLAKRELHSMLARVTRRGELVITSYTSLPMVKLLE